MKIQFDVFYRTKYGLATTQRYAIQDELDIEQTFKNCLKSLPRYILNAWESIEFCQDLTTYEVANHHFVETNFNFWQSVEVVDSCLRF